MRNRRDAIIYWTLTALFLIPSAGTAVPELLMRPPENILKTNEALGYPLYLFAILGLAKLLGTVVILAGGRNELIHYPERALRPQDCDIVPTLSDSPTTPPRIVSLGRRTKLRF
jgi:hypothetical protein